MFSYALYTWLEDGEQGAKHQAFGFEVQFVPNQAHKHRSGQQ
jgi:hypothetical protein